MPAEMDPENLEVNALPTVWSPVQWEMTPEEKAVEDVEQATAGMVLSADLPEALLRLVLRETEVEQAYEPPEGYDPVEQGEWDYSLRTYRFSTDIRLVKAERNESLLTVEYDCGGLGHWIIEMDPEECNIYKA